MISNFYLYEKHVINLHEHSDHLVFHTGAFISPNQALTSKLQTQVNIGEDQPEVKIEVKVHTKLGED